MTTPQIEWLKCRLADLQLPATKRDHDTREKWLLQLGMPAYSEPDATILSDHSVEIIAKSIHNADSTMYFVPWGKQSALYRSQERKKVRQVLQAFLRVNP